MTDTERRPTNVVEALAMVMGQIGGMEKMTQADRRRRGLISGDGEGGVTFAYRSIDQVTAKAQPLMAAAGVVIVPYRMEFAADIEHLTKGKSQAPWTDTRIRVQWRIYGPGGPSDMIEAESFGQGQDNADKGINKATTSAYKNLLLKLLMIGDPDDDTDHTPPPESNPRRRSAVPSGDEWTPTPEDIADAAQVFADLRALPDDAKARVKQWATEQGRTLRETDLRDPAWRAKVAERAAAAAVQATATAPAGEVTDASA